MIVGVLARVPSRDPQTAPNLDQSLEVCHRCDPFNEVFGAAELGDGALAGRFRLGSPRACVPDSSFGFGALAS